MVFSNLLFSFIFLPSIIILYFLAKEGYRNYILLIASLMFFAYGEPKFVYVMICLIAVNYALALGIAKKKILGSNIYARNLLILDVIVNVGILFIYKYLDFSIRVLNLFLHKDFKPFQIALPIGISFFTFQILSYVIDVYRGTVEVQKNPLYLALYISFFPQLIAGPIVRYSSIEKQMTNRICTLDGFAEGAKRFFLGFGKKVILANNLSVLAAEVFEMDVSAANPLLLWMGSICYSLQIFYDFSGYSDMAIGLGKIFGFHFEENFNYPYISQSVTEFWRRWHMSLGQWFRDYVYIPLGGSRVTPTRAKICLADFRVRQTDGHEKPSLLVDYKVLRHLLNMFIVWLLTGIWHGANYTFIAWGGYFFVLLAIEKYIVKPGKRKNIIFKGIWRIFTLLAVNFGWVVFNSSGIKRGIRYCLAMLGRYGIQARVDASVIRYFREYSFFIVAGIIFATPIMKRIKGKIEGSKFAYAAGIVVPIGYGMMFLWSTSYIILGAHNPFIYFNF